MDFYGNPEIKKAYQAGFNDGLQCGVDNAREFEYINEEQAEELCKSTGHAFEVDGTGMANQTAALENAETSSIGRALANMNLSGNKRTSREEMAKVERGVTPKPSNRDWQADLEAVSTVEAARQLWDEARTQKAPAAIQDQIKAKGQNPGCRIY